MMRPTGVKRLVAILLLLGFASAAFPQAQKDDRVYILPSGMSKPNVAHDVLFVCSKHPSAGPCATNPPRVKHTEHPVYTDAAVKAGFQGRSGLWVVVGTDGQAHEMYLIKRLGFGMDEQAINAIRRWKFAPGTRDGTPVPVAIRIDVNFQISRTDW
jgi:TonB family protein